MDETPGLSKHEQRKLKKKQREEARAAEIARLKGKKKLKRSITWIIVLVIVGGLFWWGYVGFKNRPQPYTPGRVHWHALVDLKICGQKVDVIKTTSSAMVGRMLTHTHGDNKIHIEGQISKKDDIALGKFFDGVNVKFSETQIKDKRNGDPCPDGSGGTVKMFVNDQPNTEFRNYIPKDADTVKIVFGQ